MATLAKLNIQISANAKPLAQQLAALPPKFVNLKTAMGSAFGGGVAGGFAAVAALKAIQIGVNAVQAVIARVKLAFKDAKRLFDEGLISRTTFSSVTALQNTWKRIKDGVSVVILQLAERLAPVILTVAAMVREAFGPFINGAIAGGIAGLGIAIEQMAAGFVNFGTKFLGVIKTSHASVKEMFLLAQFVKEDLAIAFARKGDEIAFTPKELREQMLRDNQKAALAGIKLFEEGSSGRAGKKFLDRVEAMRQRIANTTIKVEKVKLGESPTAVERGTAAAISAVLKARAGADPILKLAREQLQAQREAAAHLKELKNRGPLGAF